MGVTENFLVNTKNFESIIETLRTTDALPGRITNQFLDSLGYSNPSDLLVLHLFKDLKMLEQDGTPTSLFDQFRTESSSKKAIAGGIIKAYGDLFKANPFAHKIKVGELKEEFKKLFGSSKSDLILKYMANTFATLVNYAKEKNIDEVLEESNGNSSENANSVKNISEQTQNGTNKHLTEEEIAIEEAEQEVKKEEKGEAAIEDFIKSTIETDEKETSEPTADYPFDENDEEEALNDIFNVRDEDEETESDQEPANQSDEKPKTAFEQGDESGENDDSGDPFGLDEILKSTSKPPEPARKIENDKKFIDKAFVRKAELLYKLEKYEEALPAYRDIIDRYGNSDNSFFQEQVSMAIIRRASILSKMERHDQALPAFDEVIERFENSDNTELYNQASLALVKKIEIMEMLELEEQLLPLYSKVIQRLHKSDNPLFVKHVDKAYIKQVNTLINSDQPEKAIEALNGVIKRFQNSGRQNEFLEKAMYTKAELLEQTGQNEKALEAYEAFLSTFGHN